MQRYLKRGIASDECDGVARQSIEASRARTCTVVCDAFMLGNIGILEAKPAEG